MKKSSYYENINDNNHEIQSYDRSLFWFIYEALIIGLCVRMGNRSAIYLILALANCVLGNSNVPVLIWNTHQ